MAPLASTAMVPDIRINNNSNNNDKQKLVKEESKYKLHLN